MNNTETFDEWLINNLCHSWHVKYQKYWVEWLSNCPKYILDYYRKQYETGTIIY